MNRRSIKLVVGRPPSQGSEPFFTESFESGDWSKTENGFSWTSSSNPSISDENPRTGTYSARFFFEGSADGDATSERRFFMGRELTELWAQWYWYVPSNYFHRDATGTDNNKLLYLWSRNYGSSSEWGNFLGLDLWRDGSGGTRVSYNPIDHSGSKGQTQFITLPDDVGKWHQLTLHFKIQSAQGSADGVLEFWHMPEGGSLTKIYDFHDMNDTWGPEWTDWPDYNFLDKGYFMGWSNSGFDEDTIFYVDDITFSESEITPG